MKVAASSLSPIFRSDIQGRLLAAVLVTPEEERSITALAERAGGSHQTALREIDRLEAAGIITTRRVGNTRLVRANTANRLLTAYRQIVLATYGPPAIVAEELDGIEGIKAAYIFGSWAARYLGEPGHAPNDIDVLVIGDPARADIHDAAERAEERIGMPVQVAVRSSGKWEKSEDDPFLTDVHNRPMVPVIEAT